MNRGACVFTWAGTEGPCAEFFQSAEHLLSFASGWQREALRTNTKRAALLIVSHREVRSA